MQTQDGVVQPGSEAQKPAPTIREQVAEILKSQDSLDHVNKSLIQALVKPELEKRVQLMVTAQANLDKLKGELNKIRPDVTSYNEKGEPFGVPSWTKKRLEERKKAQEAYDKLLAAFNKALNGDYEALKKVNLNANATPVAEEETED